MVQDIINDIEHAFKQLEFAIRLMVYCELGHLDVSKFSSDEVTILLPEENISFPSGNFKDIDNIIRHSQINVSICFGVSAIVLDAGLAKAGVERNPTLDTESGKIRTLVYMVRCAFAHDISEPRWKVKEKYQRVMDLDLGDDRLSIDMKSLNGEVFDYNHIGGAANWFKIRDLALSIIRS